MRGKGEKNAVPAVFNPRLATSRKKKKKKKQEKYGRKEIMLNYWGESVRDNPEKKGGEVQALPASSDR